MTSPAWIPLQGLHTGAVGGYSQVTLLERYIYDLQTFQAYPSGVLEGLRLAVDVWPLVPSPTSASVVVMVLPPGAAVPNIVVDSDRKLAEDWIWAEKRLDLAGVVVDVGTIESVVFQGELRPRSHRSYLSGERVVVVVKNLSPVAWWNAGAWMCAEGEVYAVPS